MMVSVYTMTLGNIIITIGYSIVTWLLFNSGTDSSKSWLKRMKLATLGTAFLCFGVGKTSILFEAFNSWMFMLGHYAFITFGLLYFLAAESQIKGTRK